MSAFGVRVVAPDGCGFWHAKTYYSAAFIVPRLLDWCKKLPAGGRYELYDVSGGKCELLAFALSAKTFHPEKKRRAGAREVSSCCD